MWQFSIRPHGWFQKQPEFNFGRTDTHLHLLNKKKLINQYAVSRGILIALRFAYPLIGWLYVDRVSDLLVPRVAARCALHVSCFVLNWTVVSEICKTRVTRTVYFTMQ
jgi:hypothetical protein